MADSIVRYLRGRQDPATGLLESFSSSADPELHEVSFTYDLALATLVFVHSSAFTEAARLAEFFRAMPFPDPVTGAYNTAYRTQGGAPALEEAFQVGPVAWVAIALLRYGKARRESRCLARAVALMDWVRRHVPHEEGGVVMGTKAPWSERMSSENNWAYYAALRLAIQAVSDRKLRQALIEEKLGVRRWLAKAGSRRGRQDAVKALDVYSNALLVGPEAHLEDVVAGDQATLAAWAKGWIEELEQYFRVPNSSAYDFTDEAEAQRISRMRVGWLEGTEQVTVAYQTWAPFFEQVGDPLFAQHLLERASLADEHVLRHRLTADGGTAIPNTDSADPVRTFSDGWVARPCTEPALNGTTWAYFAMTGFNPFAAPLTMRRRASA